MNWKKPLIAVLAVMLIGSVVVAVAVSVYRFRLPQTVTIATTVTPAIRVMVDYSLLRPLETERVNGTMLDWGTLPRGVSADHTLVVYNDGDYDVTAYLMADMPPGWTLTWEANGTIIPSGFLNVYNDLTLTVPSDAPAGVYTWDAWIIAEPC